MSQPILTLKLPMPSPRLGLVPRPLLLTQLDQVWQPDKRLILVCAPAGYGKTSLIASWVSALQRRAEAASASPAVAWLSLDEADNNLPQFLLDLIETLKKALTREQYQTWRSAIWAACRPPHIAVPMPLSGRTAAPKNTPGRGAAGNSTSGSNAGRAGPKYPSIRSGRIWRKA